MHPYDCPNWEYSQHPDRHVIPQRVAAILVNLAKGTLDTADVATDTRREHGQIFDGLSPVGYEYYAGHYRGENFKCLRFYPVAVQGDPRVGAYPASVNFLMKELSAELRAGLLALDGNVLLPVKDKLRYAIAIACNVFVHFLTIHPYANGNGHAGRLIVWCILGRYGYWPQQWPVDPRPDPPPPNPPYIELIARYRNGDREPLESYMVQILSV